MNRFLILNLITLSLFSTMPAKALDRDEVINTAFASLPPDSGPARVAVTIIVGDDLQMDVDASQIAFAAVLRQPINDSNRAFDYDQDGRIEFGDLSVFAAAIGPINEALLLAKQNGVLNELIRARQNNTSPNISFNIAELQEQLNKLLARVDSNSDGNFSRLDMLAQLLATQAARFSQDLDYDFNLDGVVDKKDYDTINSLYKSRVPGLAGKFRLQE